MRVLEWSCRVSVLGTRVPLIQAPLGRVNGVELVLAVSQAGGLGTRTSSSSPRRDCRFYAK